MRRQLGRLGTTFSRAPDGQLRSTEGCGREEKDKQDKGGQKCGKEAGGGREEGEKSGLMGGAGGNKVGAVLSVGETWHTG